MVEMIRFLFGARNLTVGAKYAMMGYSWGIASWEENRSFKTEMEEWMSNKMMPSTTELGKFIRARRFELGVSQIDLAELVGLVQQNISRIEIGKRRYLNEEQLRRFAAALRCDAEELRKRMPVKPIFQPTTELGKLIFSQCEELGITRKGLAKRMGLTYASDLVSGLRRHISYDSAKKLAAALKLEPAVLFRFISKGSSKETKSELGKLIRLLRRELGMSAAALAERLGVSSQYMSIIELGQSSLSNSDDKLRQLALILNLDVDKLKAVRVQRRLKHKNNDGLGGFLTARRLELHLTQREVAKRAGVSLPTVLCAENKRGCCLMDDVVNRLAKALDCQIPTELIQRHRT